VLPQDSDTERKKEGKRKKGKKGLLNNRGKRIILQETYHDTTSRRRMKTPSARRSRGRLLTQ